MSNCSRDIGTTFRLGRGFGDVAAEKAEIQDHRRATLRPLP
jgi:hypothetical protein